MAVRSTFFFRAKKYGWSETFYNTSTDLQTAFGAASALAPKRAECLGGDAFLTGFTTANDDPQRDGLQKLYGGDGLTTTVFPTFTADLPTTALLFTIIASIPNQRKYIMRGQPDTICTDMAYAPLSPAGWLAALAGFFGPLTGGLWGMRRSSLSLAGPIGTMLNSLPGFVTLTIQDSLVSIPAGSLITISGGRNAQGLAGRHRVQSSAVAGAVTTIVVKGNTYVGGYMANTAKVSKVAFSVDPFTANQGTPRVIKRDTGRGFFLPVGRRRGIRLG